ncbi:AraC family transcriptional regulator [Chitiniphilus purpureus]|uniref:AraC family transcriptional regulator n=1 Tax=Chitiniphilus purpureus TaxID=2981137 RepID=A0ABY6DUA2_9NEIS|nr:AraC family transcriptional regulator [Chitiniphilus sp. CD1]UXY16626.1 AraC family transcriptional regulator [Chitiniphilus sp. CD1]
MKPDTRARYNERVLKVLDYLHQHLESEPDLYRLAEIACLSPYHFHRVYRGLMGETITETIRQMRLQRASGDLASSLRPLPEVALRAGYGSLPAFTRAFQQHFGTSPGRFRSQRTLSFTSDPESDMYTVTITACPSIQLIALPHRGSYMEIGTVFSKLMLQAHAKHWLTPESRVIGVFYDDPQTVPQQLLRSHAALSVAAPVVVEPPFEALTIPAMRCAVLRHTGPYADLHTSYSWLFGVWLPESGEQPADFPPYEDYLNDPQTTPPDQLLTNIYLPLAD